MSPTTTHPEVFEIPLERLPELHKKIETLNKKAAKIGVPPIKITEGEHTERQDADGVIECAKVTVEGESPSLNGWRFIATLEHDEDGVVIRRIPTFGKEIDLSKYHNATPDNCDYCGYKRRRNDTYIVARVLAGSRSATETQQVGSNCLKEFTGHENPQKIAKQMEAVRDLLESIRGGEYSEGQVIPRYPVVEYLTHVAALIREQGWVSKSRAWYANNPQSATAALAADNMSARRHGQDHTALVNDDYHLAQKVTEWASELSEDRLGEDYYWNLHTVLRGDSLRASQFGWAASAIQAYEKDTKPQEPARPRYVRHLDEYIGEPGKRLDFTFEVRRQMLAEPKDRDPFNVYILRDDEGHTLVWKTAKTLEEGEWYTGSFQVRKHETHPRWGKQTLVSYPKDLNKVEV